MYRALTYKVLVNNVDVQDEDAIIKLARESDIKFFQGDIYLDNNIVNEEIRLPEVNKNVSYVAKIPQVRKILIGIQKSGLKSGCSDGWKGYRNACSYQCKSEDF